MPGYVAFDVALCEGPESSIALLSWSIRRTSAFRVPLDHDDHANPVRPSSFR